MENKQLWMTVIVAIVVAIAASLITVSLTGNTVKIPTYTAPTQVDVYSKTEVDTKLATISSGAKEYEIVTNYKSAPLTSVSANCPAGKKVIGGGCLAPIGTVGKNETGPNYLVASYPPLNSFWECRWNAPTRGNLTAFAICANIM